MDYIDAEAQINHCNSSEEEEWWDGFDGDLEDFIVDSPIVPFGPRPAEYSSEGEGCDNHADFPPGHDIPREPRPVTPPAPPAPPITPAATEGERLLMYQDWHDNWAKLGVRIYRLTHGV